MSNLINIENYEAYAIDFIEGTLNEDLRIAFEAFLVAHPEIAEDFDGIEEAVLESEEVSIPSDFKQNLKVSVLEVQGINETNAEESFAMAVDEDLNPVLSENAKRFIAANPVFEKDFELYQKTKIKANLAIIHPEKSSLKQPIGLWVTYRKAAFRVAAAVTILLGASTVLKMVNNEVYMPRTVIEDFATIEVNQPSPVSIKQTNRVRTSKESTLVIAQASEPQKPKRSAIKDLPRKAAAIPEKDYQPAERTLAAADLGEIPNYFEVESQPTYAATNKSPEYTLPQFLGKKLLGIEPKGDNTREVIKEGIANLVDNNERVAVNRSELEDDKSTFELMAGRFEFKRVTYK